jgi:hypothetical protein
MSSQALLVAASLAALDAARVSSASGGRDSVARNN